MWTLLAKIMLRNVSTIYAKILNLFMVSAGFRPKISTKIKDTTMDIFRRCKGGTEWPGTAFTRSRCVFFLHLHPPSSIRTIFVLYLVLTM